jgi:AhpC/TSA family/Disulphide bond corrector protein DsbC
LQAHYDKIQAAGLGLAAISYDSPAVLQTFAARRNITFPLLSDADSKIIRAYGILNSSVDKTSPSYGIPYPGIYVLNKDGTVKAKYFGDDYRERQTAAVILMSQFGIEPATDHTSIAAKHLSLSTSASNAEARMGQHVLLSIDVGLPARVHVYAPGVQGYIPIQWKQADTPAAKSADVVFPTPQTLFLEAIKETVPVFEGHFRMSREITMGPDAALAALADKDGNVTLQGSVRYQACDDTKCFIPETVPVSWSFHFERLDRIRAKP